MSPELRFPNKTELDPQRQWEIFKEQLSYVLTYPDHEEPDTMDLPEMTDLDEATPINVGIAGFAKSLYAMREHETLGDEESRIKIISLDAMEVKDLDLVADLHQHIGIGESTPVLPVTVFFIQAGASAAMIIPIEIEYDYIVVQVSPIKGALESRVPVLRRLQDCYDIKKKLDNKKKNIDDLLQIKGITRGSQL